MNLRTAPRSARLARASLCFALAAALAPAAFAADPLPEARALIDRHIEAVGGAEAVRAAGVGTVKGRFEMPGAGVSGPLTVASGGPDRMATRVELAGIGEIRGGINGEVVWSMDPFTGPRLLEGMERAAQVESIHPDAALRADSFIASARTTGLVEMGGQSCYRVELKWRSGRETADCYSPDSGLLVATESVQVSPMGEVPVTTTLGEYKDMSGLKVATRSEQTVMGQAQVITLESLDRAEPDASLFEMPAPIKALAQAPAEAAAQ
jgi:hypothetical protein